MPNFSREKRVKDALNLGAKPFKRNSEVEKFRKEVEERKRKVEDTLKVFFDIFDSKVRNS